MLHAKPMPRVLRRGNLLMGCEREPILLSGLICGGVGLASMTLIGFVICGLLWFGLLTVCRWMAKSDPQMTRVYVRAVKQRGFYPAFSRPYRQF